MLSRSSAADVAADDSVPFSRVSFVNYYLGRRGKEKNNKEIYKRTSKRENVWKIKFHKPFVKELQFSQPISCLN